MMRTLKLKFLRIVFIIVFSLLNLGLIKKLKYPSQWMLHYLLGTGKSKLVPIDIMEEAEPSIINSIFDDIYNYYSEHDELYMSELIHVYYNKHCLHHSTIYEGIGFYNRPTLFYLVGGFTFNISTFDKDTLTAIDVYDFHSTIDGHYFTSPCAGKVIINILNFIFGNEWFTPHGFPSSSPGVSNKLWEDLAEVGAKPFDSIIYWEPRKLHDTICDLCIGYMNDEE